MQSAACICRDAEHFKSWLNFLWRTGGALLGCSSLALPLTVIGSDSCILAVDHLLWHSRWSHWRQQCGAHTCTCQAHPYSLQSGGRWAGIFKQQAASRASYLLASKIHFTPCGLCLLRHPYSLHEKDGRFVYCEMPRRGFIFRLENIQYTHSNTQHLLSIHAFVRAG